MALTVTPTSGDAPYALSADVDAPLSVDGVHYRANLTTTEAIGSCPALGTGGSFTPSFVNSLVNGASLNYNATVVSGSCRTFTLRLYRVSDNVVVSTASATVDNV